jgi:hypothetical protein
MNQALQSTGVSRNTPSMLVHLRLHPFRLMGCVHPCQKAVFVPSRFSVAVPRPEPPISRPLSDVMEVRKFLRIFR